MKKWPFLINNGRTNHVWQSAYLDQQNELVIDRWPYPFIQMNPQDMADLDLKAGDLVEVYNDNGSTQAMVYPTPTAKRKQTLHVVCLSHWHPRQCGLSGRERTHHPKLQADLGCNTKTRRRTRGHAASDI
jgi:anaerobic selenocysteine-containing dehydrogenase